MFNKGELHLQNSVGARKVADRIARTIIDTIVPGAIPFIENQNMVVLSSKDAQDMVWVSVLMGSEGFVKVESPSIISFDLDKLLSAANDTLFSNIESNNKIGGVFIELGSRRRYRVNGQLVRNEDTLQLTIEEAFANCPKYIQRRIPELESSKQVETEIFKGEELSLEHREWILKADTFFVGSLGKDNRMDVNHRGGNSGFIEILDNGALKIPDYIGNNLFNTLGNLLENDHAGLVFIDFSNGRILQLSGRGELLIDQDTVEDQEKTMSTGRYWLFYIEKWIQINKHHQGNWEFLDYSPFNP